MYLSIAIIAILTIAFFVFLYRASSRWQWVDLVLLFFVYASAIFGGLMIAKSFKVHNAWKRAYANLDERYEKTQTQLNELRYGPPTSIRPPLESVAGITDALHNELLGRGRVWENVSVQLSNGNYVATLPAPADAAAPAPAAGEAPLGEGKILYAFLQRPVAGIEGATAGVDFLGTFSVVAATGNQATLAPVFTVAQTRRSVVVDPATGEPQVDDNGKPQIAATMIFPELTAEVQTPSGQWSLYESMPPDLRDTFKRVADIQVDPQEENVDFDDYQSRYRAVLQQYMPPEKYGLSLDNPDQARLYEQLIDRYAFDMMRISDINEWIARHRDERLVTDFTPISEERLLRLKFSARSQEFEIDTETGTVKDPGIFDPQGRAVLNELKYGSKFRVEKDGVIIVDSETATKLQADGNEFVNEGEVYVRRLNDFAALASAYTAQLDDVFADIVDLFDELAALRATDADLQTQERQRITYFDQLSRDAEHLTQDLETVSQLLATRQSEVTDLKEQINKLYKIINVRYQQIKERTESIVQTTR